VLDYIRQSIEIIMNLKSETNSLQGSPRNGPSDSMAQSVASLGSCESDNLIMVSMKDAL